MATPGHLDARDRLPVDLHGACGCEQHNLLRVRGIFAQGYPLGILGKLDLQGKPMFPTVGALINEGLN